MRPIGIITEIQYNGDRTDRMVTQNIDEPEGVRLWI